MATVNLYSKYTYPASKKGEIPSFGRGIFMERFRNIYNFLIGRYKIDKAYADYGTEIKPNPSGFMIPDGERFEVVRLVPGKIHEACSFCRLCETLECRR